MSETLPPRYNFAEVEEKIYQEWEDNKCFQTAYDQEGKVLDESRAQKKTFTIAIPPPNVTGRLHMGHALNNTIQDMLIRYKRMDGFDALWIPGTDHAGIATQTVVKKMLDAQGIDYRELGREKFVEKIWEWKQKYGDMILHQLRRIGCSCNWERTRFTMDEGLSKAVNRSFKKLYDDGLIYRGERIVNWCPVDRTALSDDEVETKEGGEPGHLWHIRYPLLDSEDHLVVATTRPETLFGDVAVAVHPEDERYQKYIGKMVKLPLQGRHIPVIADEYVDREFGTGCLKITPAHDPNDFEVGKRHSLAPINVMNEDATMNDVVPEEFRGLDRFKCRKKAVALLKEQELLEKEEARKTPLGRSYRSKAVIEYRLSEQWFVKMKPLADMALEAHDKLNIQPPRWNKVYLHWINNIRDWCISRQIWWGHRIPAWYNDKTGEILVEETTPAAVLENPEDWRQENDVLDTWFSSALWPMSTLGWPDETPDFKRYFPTNTLSTAKDIIFFWVARMNFAGLKFTGKMPYENVYIHPTILDEKGETMSKSKGNGIDPLVLIEGATLEQLKQPVQEARPSNIKNIIKSLEKTFPSGYEAVGADAMRYTLVNQCSTGQEIRISLEIFQEVGRRFMTKLWNAARFIFMYVEQDAQKGGNAPSDFSAHMNDEDRWIHGKIQLAAAWQRKCLDNYEFSTIGQTYYQLIWNDFCDWYVELCKARLTSDDSIDRKTALHSLFTAFADILRLFHPVAPYITEELWKTLLPLGDKHQLWGKERPQSEILMMEKFPEGRAIDKKLSNIIEKFTKLQEFVTEIRTLRANYGIKNSEKIKASVRALDTIGESLIADAQSSIIRLGNLESLEKIEGGVHKPEKTVTLINSSFEIYLDVKEFVDVSKELSRIEKEIADAENYAKRLDGKLSNANFVQRAKKEVVEAEQQRQRENQEKLDKLRQVYDEVKQLS